MTPIIIMTIVLSIYGYTTSSICTYWEDEQFYPHANCSKRHLSLIPVVSSNTNCLDLSTNLIETIENKTFSYLSILQELNLENNMIKWLEHEVFLGLYNLERLILAANHLLYTREHFSKNVFKPLKSLTYLNLNLQIYDPYVTDFMWFSKYVISDLASLQSIVIDLTHKAYIFPKEFMLLTNLTEVKAGFCNDIDANNKTFSNVPNVDSLDLSGCFIDSYAHGTLKGLHLKYLSLQSISPVPGLILDILHDLNESPIQTLVLTDTFYSITYLSEIFNALNDTGLQNLYLNQQSVKMVQCPNSDNTLPLTLKSLDISSNDLRSVCLIMPNLKSLNLARNNLGDFLTTNTYYPNNSISYRTNLIDINLSHNSIFYLKVSIFNGHRCLNYLNISNNFLTDINFDVSHLKSLKVLDLSNNRIQKFSKETMEQLSFVFGASDIRIHLAGNILQCSCEAIEFIKWILDKKEYFSEQSEIKCKFSNETEIFLTEFTSTMMQLKKKCASRLGLISFISVAIASIIIILTIGIVYRYRWRLRYIYYMTKSKYTRENLTQNDDRNFAYDAFISYSDDEEDFIMQEVIPNLEERGNIQLCIHKRDFSPGNEILHNITTSIHESRNVICILTKSFLESCYCMFEFNMARMESIYARNGKNMLFLVFFEQLRPKDLPLVMLELIENDSYIEYPNDEQGNIVFWEKLKEAIR